MTEIEVKPSVTRAWSERARVIQAMDVHYGPQQVITCRADQVDEIIEDLRAGRCQR